MNNFFLLNEALDTDSVKDFQFGLFNLNEIVQNHEPVKDYLYKHQSLLTYSTKNGYVVELANSLPEGKLFWNIYKTLKEHPNYLSNEEEFDNSHKNQCNGFLGFDFSKTAINELRHVINLSTFFSFKKNCLETLGLKTIQNFWDSRDDFFKGLIFCESVLSNILDFSAEDDRFLLIFEKLKRLNEFAEVWNSGAFPHYEMGIKVSPDTQARLKKSSSTRNYLCPDGTPKEFSWHIKLSAGYRIYYLPDAITHKVIIGVIGTKDDLGF